MPWIGPAISAGASLLGGALQSGSANDAAREQAAATQAAIAEQQRQYNQTRTDQAPWRDAGSAAVGQLRYLLGLGGNGAGTNTAPTYGNEVAMSALPQAGGWREIYNQVQKDMPSANGDIDTLAIRNEATRRYQEQLNQGNPGDPLYGSLNKKFTLADFWDDPVTKASYQMGLDQGIQGINNMAGARGGRNSGQTLKALTRFSTDYTGNQAAGSQARYVNDQTNTYNRLAGLSGTGQTAANTVASAGQNMANNISGLTSSLGNARGAAAIASGNAWQGAGQNIANWYGQQNQLNRMSGGIGTGGSYNYLNPYNTSDAENYGGYV